MDAAQQVKSAAAERASALAMADAERLSDLLHEDPGAMVVGGRLSTMVSLLVSGIWVACTSGFVVREHLPEVTPMGLPQT
jgi:DNA-binding transcriptional LysR family regulator